MALPSALEKAVLDSVTIFYNAKKQNSHKAVKELAKRIADEK